MPEVPHAPSVEIATVVDANHGCALAVELGRQFSPQEFEPALKWIVLFSEDDDTYQIIALAHHAVFDGASISILMQHYVEVLAGRMAPLCECLAPQCASPNWNTFLRHLKLMCGYHWKHRRLLRACKGLPADKDRTGACLISRWTASETSQLLQACRRIESTLTSVLGVFGMVAISAEYGRTIPVIDLDVPINLRRYLTPEHAKRAIGMFSMLAKYAIDFAKPVDVGEQARVITRQLQSFVNYQSPLRFYCMANMLIPNNIRIPDTKLPSCVSSNSLGSCEITSNSSSVELLEWGWFANGGQYAPAFSQSAASINGRLSITSYSTWLSPERLSRLAMNVDTSLRQFAELPERNTKDL